MTTRVRKKATFTVTVREREGHTLLRHDHTTLIGSATDVGRVRAFLREFARVSGIDVDVGLPSLGEDYVSGEHLTDVELRRYVSDAIAAGMNRAQMEKDLRSRGCGTSWQRLNRAWQALQHGGKRRELL